MSYSDLSGAQELFRADTLDTWGRLRDASFGKTRYRAAFADTGRRLPIKTKVNGVSDGRSLTFDAFDAAGRITSRSYGLPSFGGTEATFYDPLGRLRRVKRYQGGTNVTSHWSFAYDPLGNVASLLDVLGSGDAALSFEATDRDRICRIGYGNGGLGGSTCNVVHDPCGNVVYEPTRTGHNELSWFASGAVDSIENSGGTTARFNYDAFGEVQDLTITQSSKLLRHDENFGSLITKRHQESAAGGTDYIARRFQAPGLTVTRHGAQGSPWVVQFSDSRGVQFTTSLDGSFLQDNAYSPFGEASTTGAQPGLIEYSTEQWNDGDALDTLGLVQVGARIYDPALGRFLSRDSLLAPRTAATSNPYAFAFNDPANLGDPSGLDPCAFTVDCGVWSSYGGSGPGSTSPLAAGTFGALAYIGAWAIHHYLADRPSPTPDARTRGSGVLAASLTNLALDQWDAWIVERGLMDMKDRPLSSQNWILFGAAAPVVGIGGLGRVLLGYGVISAPDEGTALFAALPFAGGRLTLGERPDAALGEAAEAELSIAYSPNRIPGFPGHNKIGITVDGQTEWSDLIPSEEFSEFASNEAIRSAQLTFGNRPAWIRTFGTIKPNYKIATIPISRSQAASAMGEVRAIAANPGRYNIVTNSCTTFCRSVMRAAGKQPAWWAQSPSLLFKSVQ